MQQRPLRQVKGTLRLCARQPPCLCLSLMSRQVLQIMHWQGERQGRSDQLHWLAPLCPEDRTQRVMALHESIETAFDFSDINQLSHSQDNGSVVVQAFCVQPMQKT